MSGFRVLPVVFALGLVLSAARPAAAEGVTVGGCKVVAVGGGRLRLTGPNGQEHAADVAADARVTVNGPAGRPGRRHSRHRDRVEGAGGEPAHPPGRGGVREDEG